MVSSVNTFKNRLEKVWASQELKYDFDVVMKKLNLQVQNATITADPELDRNLSIED